MRMAIGHKTSEHVRRQTSRVSSKKHARSRIEESITGGKKSEVSREE